MAAISLPSTTVASLAISDEPSPQPHHILTGADLLASKVQFNSNLHVGKAYTAQLGLAPGDEFERDFLKQRIAHHRMGVMMASHPRWGNRPSRAARRGGGVASGDS